MHLEGPTGRLSREAEWSFLESRVVLLGKQSGRIIGAYHEHGPLLHLIQHLHLLRPVTHITRQTNKHVSSAQILLPRWSMPAGGCLPLALLGREEVLIEGEQVGRQCTVPPSFPRHATQL